MEIVQQRLERSITELNYCSNVVYKMLSKKKKRYVYGPATPAGEIEELSEPFVDATIIVLRFCQHRYGVVQRKGNTRAAVRKGRVVLTYRSLSGLCGF